MGQYSLFEKAKRMKLWSKKSRSRVAADLMKPSGATEHSEGIWVRGILGAREGGLRLRTDKKQLTSFFGGQRCFMKLRIGGLTMYKIHNPDTDVLDVYVPRTVGEAGVQVDVEISKLDIFEFIVTATGGGKLPFSVSSNSSGTYLLVGGHKVSISRLGEMHWEKGDFDKPAVIFAVKDWLGNERQFKVVHDGYGEPWSGILTNHFRKIEAISYDSDRGKLEVTYHEGGKYLPSTTVVRFKDPLFEGHLDLEVAFDRLTDSGGEGVVRPCEALQEIRWDSREDLTQRGVFGTKLRMAALESMGMGDVTYDASGRNYSKEDPRYWFDVTYFHENANFIPEEVKLITAGGVVQSIKESATLELTRRMNKWNSLSSRDRGDLPLVKKEKVTIILFNPDDGEFSWLSEQVELSN